MASTPPHVRDTTELAVLDALDAMLHATVIALADVHPVACEPPPWWRPWPASTVQADRIIRQAYRLSNAIASYRQLAADDALRELPPTPDPQDW